MLKRVDEPGRAANLATYSDPHLPLASGVIEALVPFLIEATKKAK